MATTRKNTTAITNPKTKSQNTTAHTTKPSAKSETGTATHRIATGATKRTTTNSSTTQRGGASATHKTSATGAAHGTTGSTRATTTKGCKAATGNKTSACSRTSACKTSAKSAGTTSACKSKSTGHTSACKTSASKSAQTRSASRGVRMEASAELCALQDMDIISDILGGQKALIKMYGTAICECDCPKLRTILNSQLTEAAADQFDAFSYMNQRGMYPTEQAAAPKVKKAIQQYTQKGSTFKR